jgi:4-amino-4-deoxy-L-arabinose transferase-like glycosyltransferase
MKDEIESGRVKLVGILSTVRAFLYPSSFILHPSSFPRHTLIACGLIAFCGVLFFFDLGGRELTSSHEARAAQNAQTILDEGHWLVPRLFDRHLELQKPPLFYWLVALIGRLQGGQVDGWSVRLPAALSALGCVIWLYLLGVWSDRPRAGFLAAIVLATCVHFTWMAHVGRIDMPLTFAIAFALGAFHLGNRAGSPLATRCLWHFAGYTALALGVLLKGPIALVLPACVAIACAFARHGFVWQNYLGDLRATTLWWGVPWLLLVATPWFVWANYQTENQVWEVFFWYHNVERGLGGSENLAAHPWWFYAARSAIDLLPWSLVLPPALWWFWRRQDLRQDSIAKAGLAWFIAITVFLSLMRFKRADYLLPAYPGFAIFLGICGDRLLEFADNAKRAFWVSLGLGLAAYGIGWLVFIGWFTRGSEPPYRLIAQEIRTQTNRPVIFFRAESHVLHFHIGKPLDTILEWENLAIWADRPFPVYIVMPEACAREWQEHLRTDALEEVLRTADYPGGQRDRPLVVFRSRGR